MSAQHRPDVEAWRRNDNSKTEAYMWPYINLEDLIKPKLLLIFLNARARHQPHEFVHSDLKLAAFGETSGATFPAFLNEYTMLFHGRNTPATYGELVSWDDDDDAFEYMYNGIGMHPGHGLQALEIQQRIWEFLVSCCKHLLQDMPSLTTGEVQSEPAPPTATEPNVTSLEAIAQEAPYRIPARLDFSRLKALASAERNSREDHLWALREDPSYFADVMNDFAEHRQEMLLDSRGSKHPTIAESGQPLFWNRVLGNVVVTSYFGFATFDEIVKQIGKLKHLAGKYKDEIRPEDDLPSEYMEAFQTLRFILDAAKTDLILQLKVGVYPSPPLRQFCYRQPQDPISSMIQAAYQPPRQNHAVKRLMPLLDILWNEQQLFLFGLHTVVDEIERLVQADPEVKALVSSWVAKPLSSLSVVAECLHQLHLYQPWARKIEDGMELKKDELLKVYKESFKGWLPILGIKFEDAQISHLADPRDGKFNHPLHRRRDKENVDALRKAERNLDDFWVAVDRHYKSRTSGTSQHDMVAHLLSSDRAIQRTPPWIEPIKNEKAVERQEYVYQPFSTIYHDRTKQITGSFDRVSISEKPTKPKTRGMGAPSDVPTPESPQPTEAGIDQQIFTVDKRTHKVFKALFHSPSNPDLPGEIPWSDFLHAMVSTGFSAEKLHGSAWNFTPRSPDVAVERSIQFHEPHPSNKIPFLWARRYGRRLARAYGWSGDMFRLE